VFGLADALPPQARGSSTWHWDHALDRGHGSCLLRQARCAEIVENSILQADGERVRLLAWCVMPNHVHIVAEQIEGHPLANVIQAWKSASSHQLNRELGRKGRVWRREYFDRYMRDQTHLETAIAYVEENPIKAKLIDRPDKWRWSSAWRRSERFAGEDAGGPRGDQG
jgi:REP element-mobilizing transposase RayT